MKQLPVVAVILLSIVLLVQNGGSAGPRGTPTVLRTVPVNIMEVMQPSKMVAVTVNASANQVQVPITLQVGQVFVLTSWSVNTGGNSSGLVKLTEGSATPIGAVKDSVYLYDAREQGHHVIPTGIRFPRDAGGLANAYVGGAPPGTWISVQGYITDDF